MKETPGCGRSPGVGSSNPTPVFLHGKSEGQRNLAGYSPWGHKTVGHDLVTKQLNKVVLIIKMSFILRNRQEEIVGSY